MSLGIDNGIHGAWIINSGAVAILFLWIVAESGIVLFKVLSVWHAVNYGDQ